MTSLSSEALRSSLSTLLGRGARVVLAVGTLMVLARLLEPAAFGILASVLVFAELGLTLAELGMGVVVPQRPKLDPAGLDAAFWGQALWSGLVAGGLALLGGPIAGFYGRPEARWVLPVLAVGVFVHGTSAIAVGLVRRRMRFGRWAVFETGTDVFASALAIVLAALGAGFWALVLQRVTIWVLTAAAAWHLAEWRPSRRPRLDRVTLQGWGGFGGAVTLAGLTRQAARRLDRIVIARVGGASALGLYEQASRWSWFPQQQLVTALQAVVVASLSKALRTEPQLYRRLAKDGFQMVYALMVPVWAFAILDAPALLELLLGSEWLEAAPLLRCLSAMMLGMMPVQMAKQVYYAEGRSRDWLKWALVESGVVVAAVLLASGWGAFGIAASLAGARWLLLGPGLWAVSRRSELRVADVASGFFVALLASAAGASAVRLLSASAAEGAPWWVLLRDGVVFSGAYLAAMLASPSGRRGARYLGEALRQRLLRRASHRASARQSDPIEQQGAS